MSSNSSNKRDSEAGATIISILPDISDKIAHDSTSSHIYLDKGGDDDTRDSQVIKAESDSVEGDRGMLSSYSSSANISLNAEEMGLGRLLLTVAVLALALFIAAIDQTIVATATVRISEEFDSLSLAPWLANAYLLSSTALQPSTGRLSDIFGRTQMLLLGLGIFAVGSLICAVAQSMGMLLAGRAVAGIGSAGIIGLTLVIVADIVPLRKRGPFMAVFSLVFSASSVIGPLLGGVFTDHVSWRWIFWLSEPITAVVIVAVLFLLRLPKGKSASPATAVPGSGISSLSVWARLRQIDYLGIVLLVGGLLAVLLGMTLPSTTGHAWRSPRVILCLVGGTVILAIFLFVEWRVAADPIVPLRLFGIRNVASMMAASFFMGACLFTPIYYVPVYYNVVENTSSTTAGIYLLPFVIGITITSISSGILVMKYGVYRPFMWGGTAVCSVGLGLLALLDQRSGLAMRIGFLLIAGLGIGAFIQLSLIAGQAAVDPKDMASTTAVLTFFRSIGSVFGMAVMQTIMYTTLRSTIEPIDERYHIHHKVIIASLNNPSLIYGAQVPETLRQDIIAAYMRSLHLVFLAMIPFGVLMFVCTLPLRHKELARRLQQAPPPEVAAAGA
ncbi:hypothetical protein GGI21_000503 [Coemansia aciculifera]|uniref:Uncharacterized protein n=1 Tax=Coemansia aciculifera TaxID=417176 RepID=A0ACC1M7K5_9FUNG|nr:hypothetical protein IWW38_001619 [Coemansia aciculifera]KAJ2910786.1 hypothetical protein GGI21_000503 [Coemansia aciculifera]